MHTTILMDARPLSYDDCLMEALFRRVRSKGDGSSDASMCFGIAGPDGDVYRLIECRGLSETVTLFEALKASGLEVGRGCRAVGRQLLRVFRPGGPEQMPPAFARPMTVMPADRWSRANAVEAA